MISIVVPAYNEEDGIAELYRRIVGASASWNDDFELILVDDGSKDRTVEIASGLAANDRRLKIISLTRNFGHQPAVSAGLAHASGSIVAILDADLQDPPEELLPFIDKVRSGYNVVYAVRKKRKESWYKRLAYYAYYRLLKRLATLDIPLDAGDFCVMDSEVVAAINQLPERSRFVRGLRTWVGFHQVGMSYERQARFAGEPKYTFRKLVKLGLDGIINFSYRPLQLSLLAGMIVACASMIFGAIVTTMYLGDLTILGFNPRQARGWTSLILMLLLSSSVQLFCLGILGEYVGRLFEEAKQRPCFLVKKKINFDQPSRAD